MRKNLRGQQSAQRRTTATGFSLIELIVAMSVFLVVSVTSFTLFSRHQTLLSQESGVAGLNIGLRNALSQLQVDVVNAGNGQIMGPNVPAWPIGVTIVNSNPTAASCDPTATNPPTYAAPCFDQLNIVMVDANTPPIHPESSTGGCIDTSSTNTLYGVPASGYTSGGIYTDFKNGDHVLLVSGNAPVRFTTTTLTAAGSNSATLGGTVQLTFTNTLLGGGNSSSANDPLSMTIGSTVNTSGTTVSWISGNTFATGSTLVGQTVEINGTGYTVSSVTSATSLTLATSAGTQSSVPFFSSSSLTSSFCSTDWVLRLLPIQYSVAVTGTANGYQDPQLVRTQSGKTDVVMDQVIGFKVGAAWWNNNDSTFTYDYNTSDYNSNFTLVRSVRVTLIGRTVPSSDPSYLYRNPFDSGPYQIRGSSIVVDPRNLTMNND